MILVSSVFKKAEMEHKSCLPEKHSALQLTRERKAKDAPLAKAGTVFSLDTKEYISCEEVV